jgi:hypothetical protein
MVGCSCFLCSVVEPSEPKYFIVPKHDRSRRQRGDDGCEDVATKGCKESPASVKAASPQTSPVGSPQRFTYDFVPLPLSSPIRSLSPPHVVRCLVDGIPQDDADPLPSKRHPVIASLRPKANDCRTAPNPNDDTSEAHSDDGLG